jgi:hypothetical protein
MCTLSLNSGILNISSFPKINLFSVYNVYNIIITGLGSCKSTYHTTTAMTAPIINSQFILTGKEKMDAIQEQSLF